MNKAFYSVAELAGMTRESVAVWRKRLFRRELPFYKFGANTRVRDSDFRDWFQGRMVSGKEQGETEGGKRDCDSDSVQ